MTRIIEPRQLEERRRQRAKKHVKKQRKHVIRGAIIAVLALYCISVLIFPMPLLQAEIHDIKLQTGTTVSMPWPVTGQAAVGAIGYGMLAKSSDQTALPIASVAKVITAVAILKVKPINIGETGDLINITDNDVETYLSFESQGQSFVKVASGESLTQYQALQALLLPSANNIAEVLVTWAFGSVDEYLAFVNQFTKTIGMKNTVVADASGFNPGTVSTAEDLTILAEIAMNNPVLSQIVGQSEADLPVAGKVYNVNNMLGVNDIVGIKTGLTEEAGGCYMFAAKRMLENESTVTVFGVVMGSSSREQAMESSIPLINETFNGFKTINVLKTDQSIGEISQTNGIKTDIVIRQGLTVLVWSNQDLRQETKITNLGRQIFIGDEVGKLIIYVGNLSYDVPLRAAQTINNRSVLWRIVHGGGYI